MAQPNNPRRSVNPSSASPSPVNPSFDPSVRRTTTSVARPIRAEGAESQRPEVQRTGTRGVHTAILPILTRPLPPHLHVWRYCSSSRSALRPPKLIYSRCRRLAARRVRRATSRVSQALPAPSATPPRSRTTPITTAARTPIVIYSRTSDQDPRRHFPQLPFALPQRNPSRGIQSPFRQRHHGHHRPRRKRHPLWLPRTRHPHSTIPPTPRQSAIRRCPIHDRARHLHRYAKNLSIAWPQDVRISLHSRAISFFLR